MADCYNRAFDGIEGVNFFNEPAFAHSNYWLNVLLLNKNQAHERDKVLEVTNRQGIMTRPAWTLMHKLPMYNHCPRMDLGISEDLEARLINIPSSAVLGEACAET